MAGDFYLNLSDYSSNNKIKVFINTILQHNLIPVINKSTRVTRKTSTLIDNILTNNPNTKLMTSGIIHTDVSDHFPNFLITDNHNEHLTDDNNNIYKQTFDVRSIEHFRSLLIEVNWELIYQSEDTNHVYDLFLKLFSLQYNKAFPLKKIQLKEKSLKSPWLIPGFLKSSKKRQRLYAKFLKSKTLTNERNYKAYKNLFEKIKFKSKKNSILQNSLIQILTRRKNGEL